MSKVNVKDLNVGDSAYYVIDEPLDMASYTKIEVREKDKDHIIAWDFGIEHGIWLDFEYPPILYSSEDDAAEYVRKANERKKIASFYL